MTGPPAPNGVVNESVSGSDSGNGSGALNFPSNDHHLPPHEETLSISPIPISQAKAGEGSSNTTLLVIEDSSLKVEIEDSYKKVEELEVDRVKRRNLPWYLTILNSTLPTNRLT